MKHFCKLLKAINTVRGDFHESVLVCPYNQSLYYPTETIIVELKLKHVDIYKVKFVQQTESNAEIGMMVFDVVVLIIWFIFLWVILK